MLTCQRAVSERAITLSHQSYEILMRTDCAIITLADTSKIRESLPQYAAAASADVPVPWPRPIDRCSTSESYFVFFRNHSMAPVGRNSDVGHHPFAQERFLVQSVVVRL